jgi:hypothetical protein
MGAANNCKFAETPENDKLLRTPNIKCMSSDIVFEMPPYLQCGQQCDVYKHVRHMLIS